MKAYEVQKGDVLPDPGTGGQAYKVESVETRGLHVVAVVRFADGGDGVRQWDKRADVPLVRPVQAEIDRSEPPTFDGPNYSANHG